MVLPITIIGHPTLRKESEEIDEAYPGLAQLIADMFETMYAADGVGLAAPQVDHAIRLFVVDASPFAEDEPDLANFKKVFINPIILEYSGEDRAFNEGCLSVPGVNEDVLRPEKIRIEYYDESWVLREEEYSGTAAVVIQHEYDHLEGVLFTDKISPIKKRIIRSKLGQISKGKFTRKYRFKLA